MHAIGKESLLWATYRKNDRSRDSISDYSLYTWVTDAAGGAPLLSTID